MSFGSKSQKFIKNINQTLEYMKVLPRNNYWRSRAYGKTRMFFAARIRLNIARKLKKYITRFVNYN